MQKLVDRLNLQKAPQCKATCRVLAAHRRYELRLIWFRDVRLRCARTTPMLILCAIAIYRFPEVFVRQST